ncbi:MAG TPA: hypothetical protein DC049_06310 [Spirochaetia bacterium]|nr:hypothetical protein [Spirochaetia bacterium]
MFILPLLAVFILFLLGMRSEHLAGFYRKKIKIVKIALGALFLCFVIILTYSDIKNLVISCRLPGKEKTDTEKNRLELLIFASSGCKDCAILKKRVLPGMAASSGINIKIQEFPIENRDNLLYFIRLEKIYGSPGKAEFPVIIAGSNIISGKTAEEFLPAIFNSFRQGIFSNIEHPAKNSAASEKKEISEDLVNKVKILPVAGAGLLDGINPCAFVTIIFLLSYLGLLKKKQGEIIATGLAFTAGVFITYYAFGLGLYKLLKYFSSVFIYISYIIKYTGALLALALAVFSFRDAAFAGRGQESEMTLQLPLAIKQKIHSAIRDNLKTRTVVFSSFILGLLVSFFELACTGQVYLPAIIMMIEN